jgi:hypothetical protein
VRSSRSPGFYLPREIDRDVVEQRILEEAMRLPPGGAVTCWAALRMAGGNFFDGTQDVGKEDAYRNPGLECFRIVGRDLDDVGLVVDRMGAAVARAQRSTTPRTNHIRNDPGPL